MNKLTKTLLGGVALCALTGAPAIAQPKHHAFYFTALHAGRVVNKTKLRNQRHCLYHISYCTLAFYTSVPASDLNTRVKLVDSFFKLNSNSTICSNPKQKIKAPKKSVYAKIGTATETYSFGCPSGPTTFYGDTYKLTDKSGFGQTDTFTSVLVGKFKRNGKVYKGKLFIDAVVTIGTD